MTLRVTWQSAMRKAKNPPDPDYPDGIHLDLSKGASQTCQTALPYPAQECGRFLIRCETCNSITIVTAAGRIDDPRSVKVACEGH